MRSVYEAKIAEATTIERTLMQGDARLCSPLFGRICKAIWPSKTAEELAAAIERCGLPKCSVRAVGYELSGEREPSAFALHVINREILGDFAERKKRNGG